MSADSTYFHRLTTELRRRVARAVVSQTGPASDALRRYMLETLDAPPGQPGSFLAPPVFEGLFEWESDDVPLEHVPFLHEELKHALANPDRKYRGEAFPLDRRPYTHQLRAWNDLVQVERQSVVVTTGTASGKTECFLVPILDDLVKERAALGGRSKLVGTRALFLYPLNALINSQRDRLLAWTSAFEDEIRFCLYNGNTPDSVKKPEQDRIPSEILSRTLLRAEPPPILVTNATMLEFMMVRAIDAPIIEQSKGKLRWIVLDEAHTYLGSAAAELSLLLRRVMHAFDVDPKDVRFVATSATIGAADATAKLRSYLAELAGIEEAQVSVITGRRVLPGLPAELESGSADLPALDALREMNDEAAFDALTAAPRARALRQEIGTKPTSLPEILALLDRSDPEEALALLDHASRARHRGDGRAFLPLRGHFFVRTLTGLWACSSPTCAATEGTPLAAGDWPFGMIYRDRRTICAHRDCNGVVLEVVFCHGCGEAYLPGLEQNGCVHPCTWQAQAGLDDEAEDGELDDADGAVGMLVLPKLLAGPNGSDRDETTGAPLAPVSYDPVTGRIGHGAAGQVYLVHPQLGADHRPRYRCGRCGGVDRADGGLFRSVRLGAQFFLGIGLPSVIEQLPEPPRDPKERIAHPLPAGGRKLITFTDSRQGTARFALRSQLEAERNYIRASIYHQLWASVPPRDEQAIADKRAEIATLEQIANPLLKGTLETARARLAELESAGTVGTISWKDMESKLAYEHTVRVWMRESLRGRYAAADLDPTEMAQLCLLRELMRRPKRQTSLETLGLVRLRYPEVATIENPPSEWKQLAGHLKTGPLVAWRELLEVLMDFFVRSMGGVRLSNRELQRWMGVRMSNPAIVPQGDPALKNKRYAWPSARDAHRLGRIPRLLLRAFELDAADAGDRELVHGILGRAFEQLRNANVLEAAEEGFRLNLRTTHLETIDRGYLRISR